MKTLRLVGTKDDRATTLYEITEPDAMHPHVGWYFETTQGYVRGVFETENAAFMAASKEIEL